MRSLYSMLPIFASGEPVFAGGRSGLMFGVVMLVAALVLCMGLAWLIQWSETRRHASRPKPVTWWRRALNVALTIAFLIMVAAGIYAFWGQLKDS